MSANLKIRILLFLLSIGFACTALTIDFTINEDEILKIDGERIERNLHRKEAFIRKYLAVENISDSLKGIHDNDVAAQSFIKEFGDKRDIYLQTFQKGEQRFWSGLKIILESDSLLNEGTTFIHWQNGYYQAVKKSWGDFSAVFYIPVMSQYPYENEYLENRFSPELISSKNLDIASLNDNKVYNIRAIDGKYLFSVKLKASFTNTFYIAFELWMWIFAVIAGLLFLSHICVGLANKGLIWPAALLLLLSLGTFRFLDLHFKWLGNNFDIEIFNPNYFSAGYLTPSIGELLINVIAITWFLTFLHAYRYKLVSQNLSKLKSSLIFMAVGLLVAFFAYATNQLFLELITRSHISFDLTSVQNTTAFTWLGILIFCISMLNVYLVIDSAVVVSCCLNLTNKERIYLFLAGLLGLFLVTLIASDLTVYLLLFPAMIIIAAWAFNPDKGKIKGGAFIVCLLLMAVISSLKLSRFQFLKERESRKELAVKLESPGDPNAILIFSNMEEELLNDEFIVDYFKNPLANKEILQNRLTKLYMPGYLSRYDLNFYEYDAAGNNLRAENQIPLANFTDLVLRGSVKVSGYFYRKNNTFGYQHYFALIPIRDNLNNLGILVLELQSKRLDFTDAFPELLVDGRIEDELRLQDYSYAFYNDGKLLNQHGRYVYSLQNYTFVGKQDDFVFVDSPGNDRDYNHLVYQAGNRKLIVISKEEPGLLRKLASVSFIFLVLLVFSSLVFFAVWFWHTLNRRENRDLALRKLFSTGTMLYKTRIQLSMVATVVFTLIITGVITYINISQQYRDQQEANMIDKVTKISAGITQHLTQYGVNSSDNQSEIAFNTIADLNESDLNLYDLKGNLILTSEPKIYENGLIARKMNAVSYLYLNKLQKAEYISQEQIGKLRYIAAYVPLRNSKNEPFAYLGLPYFSNERDYEERVGLFLNALVNVYALVFVAIGFFAVFVANRITGPLSLIQKSIRETQIGRPNEPIRWTRDDEIGNLIKEYNTMISALEESALKLARSERETAWREMAKQVAHEIKNPLTPLKLGVQLLNKSWREQDPKFDIKFEKFSKSFIEQIESLAHIASEFSNFARMPETNLGSINLKNTIEQSMELYRQSQNTTITFENNCEQEVFVKGDNEQLLRCFNNLLKNAIEARSERENSLIVIKMYCKDDDVWIEIRDNGIGISESLGERIFTPNFTTKSSGTGLGLAFVKQSIENINGSVHFETEPGSGTTFYIRIPLVKMP